MNVGELQQLLGDGEHLGNGEKDSVRKKKDGRKNCR